MNANTTIVQLHDCNEDLHEFSAANVFAILSKLENGQVTGTTIRFANGQSIDTRKPLDEVYLLLKGDTTQR